MGGRYGFCGWTTFVFIDRDGMYYSIKCTQPRQVPSSCLFFVFVFYFVVIILSSYCGRVPTDFAKLFFHDFSITLSLFSMTIGLLKFCIRDILRKRLENMDFLNLR